MSLDHRLIALLVCPVCKGPLEMLRDAEMRSEALACPADRLAFPIRDGMPIMIESEARTLEPAPAAEASEADAAPAGGPPADAAS